MRKYHSSSRFYITDSVISVVMIIGFGFIGATATENIAAQISVVMVTTLISLWFVIRTRDRVIDVEFKEQFMVVNHIFKSTKARIQYEDIVALEFISVHRRPTINKIKFHFMGKIESIRFRTVAYGPEFIDFVKWLKSKNDNIKVSVHPPDDYMNHRLQEEYGFNYRKVPKID
ncbi:hypothetical protein L0P88_21735 [Muricauda sp. SCSIO 64092]|uniref:hypothetical protein n=1 Tax=Allomuricauda sp. SCSIO 64092 TaxID=2908842 RepID=UPI001FF15AFE|nr:hypothetical protein [Muricauda sp. SCSIO 64092]UOY06532.1 hypothetical protein L0P88_21735 [Muricauda sp. SCSIO 64092]